MKSLLFALLLSGTIWAQNVTPQPAITPVTFGNSSALKLTNVTVDPNLGYSPVIFYAYQPSLGTYLNHGNNFAHASAVLQMENLNSNVRIDSFNPNGATDFAGGLIAGTLNLIFNGNSGKSAYIRF